MGRADFGQYSAFDTQGGIRFMKEGKLASESVIPPEAVAYLKKQLGAEVPNIVPPRPVLTDEEKAKLREESLRVPEGLERTDAEMAAARPDQITEPLTENDFDVPPAPQPEPMVDLPPVSEVSSDPKAPDPAVVAANNPTLPAAIVDPNFLESVSIHTASLTDIAEALYTRFGIYSVYLNKLPTSDEVNPLTGEQFTKYHMGIAYQAAIRAQNIGILNRDPGTGRMKLDEGRAAHENMQVDPVPQTMGDARRADSFAYRTSVNSSNTVPRTEVVHEKGADGVVRAVYKEIPVGEIGQNNGAQARYDKEEDEMIVEPKMGGRPVIRPNW